MNPILETRSYIESLVANGGPSGAAEQEFSDFIAQLGEQFAKARPSAEWLADFRSWFGESLSPSTMQGFAFNKPHGYAGDFEIIDRIYQRYISPDPRLAAWDRYWQEHAAARAVRNRKTYFHELLLDHAKKNRTTSVLNVASGPSRDIFEFFYRSPDAPVTFECIEQDFNAIQYAKNLCEPYLDKIEFTSVNALRFKPSKTYDIVWSAGLFDYFNDSTFVRLLSRLSSAIAPGGELVIGNFSDKNPSRPYMEFFEWNLQHRSAPHLLSLAERAGFTAAQIKIGSEPEGVNLFLHVRSVDV